MPTSMLEVFRDRFRELVDAKGISRTKCAKKIGISFYTFNEIYTRGKNVRSRILILIAKYFDVSLDYVMGLSNDKKRKGTK